MNIKSSNSLTFWSVIIVILTSLNTIHGQRNLLHWKHDIEYRLNSYLNQRRVIDDIIASSIYSTGQVVSGPTKIASAGNVRFMDLIIPTGSLLLDSYIADSTVRILLNKTQGYVNSKMNDLYLMKTQLDTIKRQVDNQERQYIFKGLRGVPTPQINMTIIPGMTQFKQVAYARSIEAEQVNLRHINYTNVDQVINEVYMDNMTLGTVDAQSRLFFEGRKTFWRTVFVRQLRSGCCDRLRPLHTNRMMIKSLAQDVQAPVLINTNSPYARDLVVIDRLIANSLYNRVMLPANGVDEIVLAPTLPENVIVLNNLINIRVINQPDIMKTLVFKDAVMIEDVQLINPNDPRPLIGFNPGTNLFFKFDISMDNYLLRFVHPSRNGSYFEQAVGGLVINGESHFVSSITANYVNGLANFGSFVGNIVRIDRPATIRGPVQFDALPAIFNPQAPLRPPHNVLIMHLNDGLEVGLINGLNIPDDLIFLPRQPNIPIRFSGNRHFLNRVIFDDLVQVNQLVNGMAMPAGVIPLHLNDFMASVGPSNLWFVDGIVAQHLMVEGGRFGEINLRDVYGDAQSLMMQSVFVRQPDGTDIIRAPLRVLNLKLFGSRPDQGLLNGFKPQGIFELSRIPMDTIYGRKEFIGAVEATDCTFGDLNNIANWTNHLIRIDRPNTVQTVYSRLAFVQPPSPLNFTQVNPLQQPPIYVQPSSVKIHHFNVQFQPNNHPIHHLSNFQLSPEFYILHLALVKVQKNETSGGRYRVLDRIHLTNPIGGPGRVNGILLNDIVRLDQPFRFADRFVLVGKVNVSGTLRANRITSSYPIDAIDLVQFDRYRIPINGMRGPIRLNNLLLGPNNRATFVHSRMLNGIPFSEFANSIMSLSRPQVVNNNLIFTSSVNLDGIVRTESSVNGVKRFREFANQLRSASFSFEDGLQCNSVIIKV